MDRRQFIKNICIIPLLPIPKSIKVQTAINNKELIKPLQRIKLGQAPIAGFQFYEGENQWAKLKINDSLKLIREADNKYDKNAIIVKWQGHKIGYVPRKENTPIAELIDDGKQLSAGIIALSESNNPWKRIEITVYQKA